VEWNSLLYEFKGGNAGESRTCGTAVHTDQRTWTSLSRAMVSVGWSNQCSATKWRIGVCAGYIHSNSKRYCLSDVHAWATPRRSLNRSKRMGCYMMNMNSAHWTRSAQSSRVFPRRITRRTINYTGLTGILAGVSELITQDLETDKQNQASMHTQTEREPARLHRSRPMIGLASPGCLKPDGDEAAARSWSATA
jgi:hypothetical protein